MIDETILEHIVARGVKLGANYVEVRYHKHRGSYAVTRMNKTISVGKVFSEGVAIRVLVKGSLGFASTNNVSKDSLERALEKAVSRAKAFSYMYAEPISFADAKTVTYSYEVKPVKDFNNVSIGEKIGFYKEVYNSLEASLMQSTEKGTIQRMYELGASGGLELLDKWDIVSRVAEEAKMLEKVLLKGKSPPKGKIDVILGSEIVGLMVHESAGHPSEADRILGREAAQAGESFIKKGMLGKRIGSEASTVIDDPTIPGSYGYYLYDDECVEARPKYLYKNGIINEHLHNRWTAKVFNTVSNGSARAMDYTSEPIIRMSNTYFKPGDYSFKELLEDIRVGVYIKSYMEWNIDDVRWSQRYVGLEAYLIENGEIKEPIRNPVIELTTKGFYESVDAADKSLEFHAGTCGKGEPHQGVPVWFGGPNVRLRNIVLGVAPY
ncbi:MAG: TldD-like protein [Desulfurococcales archaeon ex4484_217_1]|nr:MAG: TldD-like protein [Desulfurococcales archaeon ex4484_217_1]